MMNTVSLAVALLTTSTKAQAATAIPNTGNFFYMVAPSGTNAPGINGFDVTVGKDATGQGQLIKNVAISASEQLFRVVETANTQWTSASSRYTQANSKTSYAAVDNTKTAIPPNTTDDIMSVTGVAVSGGNQLKYVDEDVTTNFFYDDVKFAIDDYKRSVQLKGLGIGAITKAGSADNTEVGTPFFNGWMGIGPYQSLSSDMQPFSFMKQLVDTNVITNDVIAINARDSADGVNSDTLVKFGGWDPNMTLDGTLMVLKTVLSEETTPKTQYALMSKNWFIGA